MKARRCCPFGRRRVAVALLGVAVTGMAAFGEAFSADYSKARTDRWRCRLCPFDDAFRREGIVTAGVLAVGDSQPRFGRDNGLDRAGSYADVAVDARYSDEAGRIASVHGTDLGLDARQLRMRLADPRAGAAALQWREVPRNVAVDGRTPYVSDGDGSLSLPADWTRAYDTAEMTGLGLAPSFRLATHRRRLGADWRFEPSPGWRLHADYLRETKRGTEETGADFLYQAAILPKPVEYRTETFGVRGSFQARPLLLAVEAREARFANAKPALTWESAYPGPVPVARKSLAPSNALRTLSWTARSALGRTSFHTRLSWSRGHQDEAFVSGTAGDVLAGSPLPAQSLDGHIHGFAGSVRAVSRVTERLRLDVSHRRWQRDNRTPLRTWTPVLGDLVAMPARTNRAHGFDRRRTELQLRYRLPRGVRLAAGASKAALGRQVSLGSRPEVVRNEEARLWLEAAVRWRGFGATVKASRGHRQAAAFEAHGANNPLTRRFHQAERELRGWKARLHGDVGASGLALGLYADQRRNDYPDSALGRLHDEDRGWGVDFSYAFGTKATLSGFHDGQRTTFSSAGSAAFGVADWWSTSRDAVAAHGLTFESRLLANDRLHLSLAYVSSFGEGVYRTTGSLAETAGASIFPALVSGQRSLDITVRYRYSDRVTLALRHYGERYRSADWAFDGVAMDTIRNVLTTGRAMPRYSNRVVGLLVEARW
ncbi:MAG: MtrB/PioB family decaheme-associated outer membrane protein [Gammaproteobacteria bacterium]|nr:MtrB/PioB family decaheme-associated outer membrane protein [Gammaproteobacteria bacterium]